MEQTKAVKGQFVWSQHLDPSCDWRVVYADATRITVCDNHNAKDKQSVYHGNYTILSDLN